MEEREKAIVQAQLWGSSSQDKKESTDLILEGWKWKMMFLLSSLTSAPNAKTVHICP